MKKWLVGLGGIILLLIRCHLYLKSMNEKKAAEYADALRVENEQKEERLRIDRKQAFDRIKLYADSAKAYIEDKGLRDDYCFLVDFSIHSGKNRFFVWSFEQDTIVEASLCCHGYGSKGYRSTGSKIVFSNVEGSYCSSLGRYQTAYRDACSYGTLYQYRLYGLDKTNDNAYRRAVTLHSFDGVPDEEMYPSHIPLGYSQGCLVVSNAMLDRLDVLLKKSTKRLLIWVYI